MRTVEYGERVAFMVPTGTGARLKAVARQKSQTPTELMRGLMRDAGLLGNTTGNT